jgi:hypothetical protein
MSDTVTHYIKSLSVYILNPQSHDTHKITINLY